MNIEISSLVVTGKPLNKRYDVFSHISVEGAHELHAQAKDWDSNIINISLNGKVVLVTSMLTDRVQNLINNCKCVSCERTIDYFSIEKNSDHYHFNAYTSSGMMMTRDHVVPRSKGGKDHISNYQLMCYECNTSKDSLDMKDFLKLNSLVDANLSFNNTKTLSSKFYNLEFKKIKDFRADFSVLSGKEKLTYTNLSHLKLFYKGKEIVYLKDNIIVPLNLVFTCLQDLLNLKEFDNFIYLDDFINDSKIIKSFL